MPIVQVSALPQRRGVDVDAVSLAIALAVSGELVWDELRAGRVHTGGGMPGT